MIKGCKYWSDRNNYYIQTNNSIENLLKSSGDPTWTESCGPTAMLSILGSMGVDTNILSPGGWMPQPEDVLTLYLNDPANYDKFKIARDNLEPGTYPGNRIPQYYPIALKEVFGVEGSFSFGAEFDGIAKLVAKGRGVMLCLKNPGHFIAIVGYDVNTQELIYNDPWPENYWPARYQGITGFNRRMNRTDFLNVQNYKIVVGA